MKRNNLYNFKNPIKHFLNIDSIKLPPDIESFPIEKLSWVEPINFRVKKQDDMYRSLKMPNVLNFFCSYEHFNDMPNFDSIEKMDLKHKRISANIETGDFVSIKYDRQLEEDFEKLCIYDNLIKLDIKDYYGKIYTHKIDFGQHEERYLSNLNLGGTNGLLLGNYLSLYFAETYLVKISSDISFQLAETNIDCEFSYFSDDFYFFCNVNDNDKVVNIFDKVLENHNFERNDNKKEIWTYETFNNHNLVTRYWKKVMSYCIMRFKKNINHNNLYFINQIVYRMSMLTDDKLKKVFINNFFKTKYFKNLNLDKHQIRNYDYHQLGFILKFSPEALLYTIPKFNSMNKFDSSKLYKFFEIRYNESLKKPFNEEQLYFYFANKIQCFDDILVDAKNAVLQTSNQVLISYYLKDEQFSAEDIDKLKLNHDECYWFQNYHLILYTDLYNNLDDSISKYLVPKYAKSKIQKDTYLNFYKDNLISKISLIKDILDINKEIQSYLDLKIEESEAIFKAKQDH